MLTEAEILTSMPPFHQKILTEGRNKRGTEAVLTQALCLEDHSDDSRLIYVSPELVDNIKYCKYGLGWDTSYKNYHRIISIFVVPHMSLYHQQVSKSYQDRLVNHL